MVSTESGHTVATRQEVRETEGGRFFVRLGPTPEAAGDAYELLRRKLSRFFDRRGCSPRTDELVDATLDRVARNVEDGKQIRSLGSYVFGVVKNVFLEYTREPKHDELDENRLEAPESVDVDATYSDATIECLRKCLKELPQEKMKPLQDWYLVPDGSKKEVHERIEREMGTRKAATRVRIHRYKNELRLCLEGCSAELRRGETKPGNRHTLNGDHR